MSSTEPLYFVFLVAGFTVGFGHCVGMCGPIVVSLSLNLERRRLLLPHLLYNSGRLITYAILGGLAGILGSFTILASSLVSVQKGVMVFAGVVVLLMGLATGRWAPLVRVFGEDDSGVSAFSKWFRRLSGGKSSIVCLPLGLILGLLPCGPVYTALVASAREGMNASTPIAAFLAGSGLMLAFGLGTFPALLVVGNLARREWVRSRDLVYKISSVLMILLGIHFIIQGIRY